MNKSTQDWAEEYIGRKIIMDKYNEVFKSNGCYFEEGEFALGYSWDGDIQINLEVKQDKNGFVDYVSYYKIRETVSAPRPTTVDVKLTSKDIKMFKKVLEYITESDNKVKKSKRVSLGKLAAEIKKTEDSYPISQNFIKNCPEDIEDRHLIDYLDFMRVCFDKFKDYNFIKDNLNFLEHFINEKKFSYGKVYESKRKLIFDIKYAMDDLIQKDKFEEYKHNCSLLGECPFNSTHWFKDYGYRTKLKRERNNFFKFLIKSSGDISVWHLENLSEALIKNASVEICKQAFNKFADSEALRFIDQDIMKRILLLCLQSKKEKIFKHLLELEKESYEKCERKYKFIIIDTLEVLLKNYVGKIKKRVLEKKVAEKGIITMLKLIPPEHFRNCFVNIIKEYRIKDPRMIKLLAPLDERIEGAKFLFSEEMGR